MSEDKSVCISVIIPAYNASATIGLALDALSRQICFQPYEVIVVDDGSTDQTAAIVSSFSSVKYIRQENAGPAAARNHGARLAIGEYLAFTDSDCIPHKNWISLLMEGFSLSRVGAVAGSYGIANPASWLARSICKEILWRHAHLMPDHPNSFGSYNFCIRKNVFKAVGGFNISYRQASGEDNDLSYKVIQSGWRIYFERKAIVDHYHPADTVKYLKEQFRHGFWRLKMYRDHPRMMRGDGYTFWKDIIEIPLSVILLAGMLSVVCHGMAISVFTGVILFPFLMLEIFFAIAMTRSFFEGILFGFVFLFRAVSRTIGLSTGILSLLIKKREKIF